MQAPSPRLAKRSIEGPCPRRTMLPADRGSTMPCAALRRPRRRLRPRREYSAAHTTSTRSAAGALAWVLGGALLWTGRSSGTSMAGRAEQAAWAYPSLNTWKVTGTGGSRLVRVAGPFRRAKEPHTFHVHRSRKRRWEDAFYRGSAAGESQGVARSEVRSRCAPDALAEHGFASQNAESSPVHKERTGEATRRRQPLRSGEGKTGAKLAEATLSAADSASLPHSTKATESPGAAARRPKNLNGESSEPSSSLSSSKSRPVSKPRASGAVRMRKFSRKRRSVRKVRRHTNTEVAPSLAKVEPASEGAEPSAASIRPSAADSGELRGSGAAAAREIVFAAERSRVDNAPVEAEKLTDAEEGVIRRGGNCGGQPRRTSRPRRKCPPAVGFVSGFKDIREEGDGSREHATSFGSSINGASGARTGPPPGVQALMRALSEPLKPKSRRMNGVQRSQFLINAHSTSGRGDRSSGVVTGPFTGNTGVSTKKTLPHPDSNHAYPSAADSKGDRHPLRIDPPMRGVAIYYNENARTLLSAVTTNTDIFGDALNSRTAADMSRSDLAAYLERWLLVAVKHGVAPRDLRALLQDRQPDALNSFAAGSGGGNGDGDDGVRAQRGRWADSAAVSWTKYGWRRLDSPPASRVGSGPASFCAEIGASKASTAEESDKAAKGSASVSSASREARGVHSGARDSLEGQDVQEDEEAEEEEMENVAEALVGGAGSQEAEDWNLLNEALSGHDASPVPPAKSSPATSKPQPAGSKGTVVEGETALGEEVSLGWRVLEAVEARFSSGLHPPRIIAIGDVHGCLDELKDLVRKVEYWPGDLLLFLGDLVAKGPSSAEVVRLARELGALSVRGNHEFEVLRWLNVGEPGEGRSPSPHHKIALGLSEEDGAWLKACPWYFRCDTLDSLFVHAGFVSGVNMGKQNPRMMMNMRSVSSEGVVTSKVLDSSPWAKHWKGPETVFFGHDAERGLQLMDHAVGIDTGCVYGGRLTACILPERRLVSVASKAAYIAYGKRRGKGRDLTASASAAAPPKKSATDGSGLNGVGNVNGSMKSRKGSRRNSSGSRSASSKSPP